MWRRGFFAEAALLYDFPTNDPGEYLNDYRHLRCEPLVAWRWLYKHKLALRTHLLSMGLRQPETVAYIYEQQIVAGPLTGSPRTISPDELAALLCREGTEYLAKPEDGGGGRDAFLSDASRDDWCGSGGKTSSRSTWRHTCAGWRARAFRARR